jgi:hypothetical protein
LTCKKCCGVTDCCPHYLPCCSGGANWELPRKLYLTISDPSGYWPCSSGASIELTYDHYEVGPGYVYNLKYPSNSDFAFSYDVIPGCENAAFYNIPADSCLGTPYYDCDRKVYIYGYVAIADSCKLSGFFGWGVFAKDYLSICKLVTNGIGLFHINDFNGTQTNCPLIRSGSGNVTPCTDLIDTNTGGPDGRGHSGATALGSVNFTITE